LESVRNLLLKDRVALANLLRVLWLEGKLFTTEDDALEQEDMIFAVDVGLCHDEDVFKQEFAKVGNMMTFPVFNPAFEVSDSLHILGSTLSFVDLVRDTFGGCTSSLEFVVVWIVSG
jgi:hypothetical protein